MKYKTVVIDPPWEIQMQGKYKHRPNRAQKLPYKTMSIKDIKEFPIRNFAEKGAHVYLWTTNKFLPKAFEILKFWGVNYHMTLVFVKPNGMVVANGYKSAIEFCLLGFYGKPMQRWIGIAKLNWIKGFNKSGEHSSKPSEFYNLIKKMSPEPRIDIFARRVIASFDAWGDEAPKEKQEELICK